MLQKIKDRLGLYDFGGEEEEKIYYRLCAALFDSADLSGLGTQIIKKEIERNIYNRLCLVRVSQDQKRSSSAGQLKSPVFVVGLPRSGTSLMFELLRASGEFRSFSFKEALCPFFDDEEGACLEETAESWPNSVQRFHEVSPDLGADCEFFMASSFSSPYWSTVSDIGHIPEFHTPERKLQEYVWHREFVSINDGREAPWLFKGTSHIWNIPELLIVYPDARLVFMERETDKLLKSWIEMAYTVKKVRCQSINKDKIAKGIISSVNFSAIDGAYNYAKRRANAVVKVNFSDLMAKPEEVAIRVMMELGVETNGSATYENMLDKVADYKRDERVYS